MADNLTKLNENDISIRYLNKGYRIFVKGEKYKFLTEKCTIPFGVEKYSNKDIVNLEFDVTDNNAHNYVALIRDIDKIFGKINKNERTYMKVPYGIHREFEKTYYTPSLRNRENNKIHHRCHLKKGVIHSSLCKTNNNEPNEQIEPKYIKGEIVLDHIWKHKDMYGLVWMLTDIQEC